MNENVKHPSSAECEPTCYLSDQSSILLGCTNELPLRSICWSWVQTKFQLTILRQQELKMWNSPRLRLHVCTCVLS